MHQSSSRSMMIMGAVVLISLPFLTGGSNLPAAQSPPVRDTESQEQPEHDEVHRWPVAQQWQSIARKVVTSGVSMLQGSSFHRSMWYWSEGSPRADQWPFKERLTVHIINGDLQTDITAGDHSIVHVLGDLKASIRVGNHSEVVIGGSLMPGANIEADGSVDIYVGGDVEGKIISNNFACCWIAGSVPGEIATGDTYMSLYVQGDFAGQIRPFSQDQDVRLGLVVGGFMARARIDAIPRGRMARLTASLGKSDQSPGIYSDAASHQPIDDFWWVVQEKGAPSGK